MPKSEKQLESERTKRRAHIRRGMKIALYEVDQVLARHGLKLALPWHFIPYTVALAEGGRRNATFRDRMEAFAWHVIDRVFRRPSR